MQIKEKTKLIEILKNKEGKEILEKYNLPCLSCPFAKMEIEDLELGKVCEIYGIDAKKVIEELNKKLKNEKGNN